MSYKNYLRAALALFAFVPCAVSAQLGQGFQDRTAYDEQLNSTDLEAVREFLKDRRAIEKKKDHPDLKITGDVRFEWRHMKEEAKGVQLRKGDFIDNEAIIYEHEFRIPKLPISANDFDVEFNLRFDYVTDDERTWAVGHVQYDNSAGVNDNDISCFEDARGFHGSGVCNKVCLKKAFVGYNVCHNDISRFDIEIGRSSLYNAFESRIQFDSRYDGIYLYYERKAPVLMEKWYWGWGGFVVDERVNQLAWATEIGLLNICNSNVDFKYSFIDWEKHGINRCRVRNPEGFKFLNSQFTLTYRFDAGCFWKKGKLYGAFLINHAGRTAKYSNFSKTRTVAGLPVTVPVYKKVHNQNKGWYFGCFFGEIQEEGDWTLDICYQVVQAFAIPDGDVSGIGRGNVLDESVTGIGARGNTNYKGWRFETLYAITDNFTLDTIVEFSTAYNKKVGGSHKYSKLELETIYAF